MNARACVVSLAHPRDAWPHWIAQLGVDSPHEVVFRVTHPAWQEECGAGAALRWGRAAGARGLRHMGTSPISDPGLAAARHLANRTQWTSLVSVERDDQAWRAALQDRRGDIVEFLQWQVDEFSEPIRAATRRLFDVDSAATSGGQCGLVCLGDSANDWGPLLAEAIGTPETLIPEHPESWPLLGMFLSPILLEFITVVPERASIADLRAAFARLMDEASDAITREGFDLDDADCTRHVRFRNGGGEQSEMQFEKLVNPAMGSSPREDHSPGCGGEIASMNLNAAAIESVIVRAVIHPAAPDWPVDIAPPLR
ncbi:MAG TPA: hypothetical protein VNT79_11240 [Phycisphaerae bacterium]|nr:hypothetical protein [Phycisphaerae bacterium]